MSISLLRAWLAGAAVIAVAYMTWFFEVEARHYSVTYLYFLWLSHFFAAIVSAYLAPRWKMTIGMSMAPTASVFASALNFVAQWRGMEVDFPGVGGALVLFGVTLAYSGVLCGLGSLGGRFLAKRLRPDSRKSEADS